MRGGRFVEHLDGHGLARADALRQLLRWSNNCSRVGRMCDSCAHTNGRAGIALAAKLQPDLLLLDMQLPDIDGIEVLQRLKKDCATRELRVVVLSADAMPEDLRRARAFGAEEYRTKPLAFESFLADVSRLLVRQHGLVAQGS
jgi:CheY-like chemotaxis protein